MEETKEAKYRNKIQNVINDEVGYFNTKIAQKENKDDTKEKKNKEENEQEKNKKVVVEA